MRIKNLPQEIKELALLRKKEQVNRENEYSDLEWAFAWERTKEGYDFWESINEGNFEPFYELQNKDPKESLFKEMVEMLEKSLKIYGRGYKPKDGVQDTVGSLLYKDIEQLLTKAKQVQ